jgi:hypothetical protein
MKTFALWAASFCAGAVAGLGGAWFVLAAMAGFPNRSGGGSWDLGPVTYPLVCFPAYVIAQWLTFACIDPEKGRKRAVLSAAIGATLYVVCVFGFAKAGGYRG